MSKIAVVLVLPIEYDTSSMLRCRTIIKALASLGNEILCYCPYPDTNNKYFNKSNINIPYVRIIRFGRNRLSVIKSNTSEKNNSLKSVVYNLALSAFRKIDVFGSSLLYLPERKTIAEDIKNNKCEILLSFSDPMPAHMIAKYCKKVYPEIKYIQQWGDPLANDTISKIAQPFWVRKIIESLLIKPADKVCYVSPFTYTDQKKLFPKYANKMCFLPTPSLEYSTENVERDKLRFGYFGSYNSVARNIIPFYEAAKMHPEAEFYIIGDSDICLKSTNNVYVIDRLSHEELNTYMEKINIIVCIMNKKGNQIPGKVYHDASSTKDILLITDGEYGSLIKSFFKDYNHYTFSENTIDSINEAILNYRTNGIPTRAPVKAFNATSIAKELIK